MKNITAIMIILVLALTLASCTGNNAEPAETGNTTAATTGTTAAETTVMTTVETEETADITPLLEGMSVYDIHYVPDTFLSEFEDVCDEKMQEYADFDSILLFACRFIEHPDVALIGQITNDEYGNKYRGINSVIWKGERYYTPEYKDGPGFDAYITSDFIALDSTGSFTGMTYFIYENGVEYHEYPEILKNSWPTFTMDDGEMRYYCVSEQYSVASNQDFSEFYLNYTGHDDYYGSSGIVQLVDGKIEYVEESVVTLEEWYAEYPFKEQYGETLDEFLESIRDIYNLKIEDLGNNWRK